MTNGIVALLVMYALFAYGIVTLGQLLTWAHWQFAMWRASQIDDELGKAPRLLVALGGAAAGIVFFAGGEGARGTTFAMLAVVLAVVITTDVRLHRIYNVNLLCGGSSIALVAIAAKQAVPAALGCALTVLAYVAVGATLRAVYGRPVFADGDYKLGAVIGLALGPGAGPMAIALALACGALVALVRRSDRGQQVAFAPYLTSGAVLAGAAVRLPAFGG